MSEQRPDDPRLEDGLREALRDRASEQPRAEIDARILAAARRAVDSRPRPAGARRWFPRIDTPLATAAVVMISAALLVLMREQGHFDGAMVREIREQAQPAATSVPEAGAAGPASEVSAESQPVDAAPASTAAVEAAGADVSKDATAEKAEAAATTPAAPAAGPTAAPLPADDTSGGAARFNAAGKKSATAAGNSATPAPAAAPMREEAPAAETLAPPAAQAFPDAAAEGEVDVLGAARDKSRLQVDEARRAAPVEATAPAAEMYDDSAATMSAPAAAPEAATPMLKQAPAAESGAPSAATNATIDNRQRIEARDELADERAKAAAPERPRPPTEQELALKGIRDLIAAGRYSDARLALARFAKTYPDYRLPADIIAALKPAD